MKIESLANSVEGNIIRVFKKFKEKPAVFLSKSDVLCYLYYLLVTDPFLGYSPTITNLTPSILRSKTFLVHAGLNVSIEDQDKQVALSVGESTKETGLSTWDFLVGIEIEHNIKTLEESRTSLAEDVKKIASYKRGYLLCLNWENPIPEDYIKEVEKLIKGHENVRFYYIDLCTNIVKKYINKNS